MKRFETLEFDSVDDANDFISGHNCLGHSFSDPILKKNYFSDSSVKQTFNEHYNLKKFNRTDLPVSAVEVLIIHYVDDN